MRPFKIVSAGAIAALVVTGAAFWLSWPAAGSPGGGALPRLPAIVVSLIAVYGLVTIVATTGSLVAAAIDLRRDLGHIRAMSQADAALVWLAGFEASVLRPLVPRATAPGRQTGTRLSARFDPRTARAEAAHLYYISLARTHSFGALVGLAALAALGFVEAWGAAPFLPAAIPAGPAVVVLVGLLMLLLLGRCAIDVTTDPLIETLSRLPWEPSETAGLLPDRLVRALEEGSRALTEAGARLSAAAGTLDDSLASMRTGIEKDDADAARLGALQAAVEALTAELRPLATSMRAAGEPAATAAAPELARELRELLQQL